MTTDLIVRFLDDVCSANDRYVLVCPQGARLAAVEICHVDRWCRDRSGLWRVCQGALARLGLDSYLLHGARIQGKTALQLKKLEKRFWPSLGLDFLYQQDVVEDEAVHPVQDGPEPGFFGWLKLKPQANLSVLDPLLATDRYFLVAGAGDMGPMLNGLCQAGWRYDFNRGMQIPLPISAALARQRIVSMVPLGRFDDPDFSVICLVQPDWAADLFEAIKAVSQT
ncbi:hypothetical protein N8I74_18215 [Chitiniphilus purpureus]|uniref:Uncharacterized protein n=1 Tax=Chitiniphilus purpureus TaxID=2981137 RepID=A0ABY6DLL0_9NEIS|nr:hypothetical protein [Chitiniphilus sp. CD1]UXY15222.1 hypothetical protein N8I74_18215 [Chitiniphilus sp. CD1]